MDKIYIIGVDQDLIEYFSVHSKDNKNYLNHAFWDKNSFYILQGLSSDFNEPLPPAVKDITLLHSTKTNPIDILDIQNFMPFCIVVSDLAKKIIVANSNCKLYTHPIQIIHKSDFLTYHIVYFPVDESRNIDFQKTKFKLRTNVKEVTYNNITYEKLLIHNTPPSYLITSITEREPLHFKTSVDANIFCLKKLLSRTFFIKEVLKIELEKYCVGFNFTNADYLIFH